MSRESGPQARLIKEKKFGSSFVKTPVGREGYEVVTFADGIQAMHWMAEKKTVPHVILLDILLPRMDGFEVARRIKQHQAFRQTVVIMLSRRDGPLDLLKGRLAGAKDYITKPFRTEELIEAVKKHTT